MPGLRAVAMMHIATRERAACSALLLFYRALKQENRYSLGPPFLADMTPLNFVSFY